MNRFYLTATLVGLLASTASAQPTMRDHRADGSGSAARAEARDDKRDAKRDERDDKRDAKRDERDDKRDDKADDKRDAKRDERDDKRDDKRDERDDKRDAKIDAKRADERPRQPGVRRVWKLERPVISSYWPTKGKAGTNVIIRGQNFAAGSTVMWGPTKIDGAMVSPTAITFVVPAGAASGVIVLRDGSTPRGLAVGAFEVVAYDAGAEAKRLEAERRKLAEAAWTERQKSLGKDRAARDAELARREQELAANRDDRRTRRLAEVRGRWQVAFLADADTQAELTLHAQRVATLERMARLADSVGDGKLAVRITIATTNEAARHDQRMAALETAFKAGTP